MIIDTCDPEKKNPFSLQLKKPLKSVEFEMSNWFSKYVLPAVHRLDVGFESADVNIHKLMCIASCAL